MKKLTIILFIISISVLAFGQSIDDNTITISNYQEVKELSAIKRILITNGYELKEFNIEEGYFSTEPHPIEGSVYSYDLKVKIIGFVQDDDLVLTANYSSQYPNPGTGGMTDASGRASFRRRKYVSKRLSFDELNRIAKKISPDLLYSKE